MLKVAKKTKGIVTVEEHSIIAGLGDRVSSVVYDKYHTVVKKIDGRDVFDGTGNLDKLLEKYGLTTENIINTVIELIK